MRRLIAGALLTLAFLALPTQSWGNGPFGFGFNICLSGSFAITPAPPCNPCQPCFGFGPCFAPAYCGMGLPAPQPHFYNAAAGVAMPYGNPAMCYGYPPTNSSAPPT